MLFYVLNGHSIREFNFIMSRDWFGKRRVVNSSRWPMTSCCGGKLFMLRAARSTIQLSISLPRSSSRPRSQAQSFWFPIWFQEFEYYCLFPHDRRASCRGEWDAVVAQLGQRAQTQHSADYEVDSHNQLRRQVALPRHPRPRCSPSQGPFKTLSKLSGKCMPVVGQDSNLFARFWKQFIFPTLLTV